MATLESDRELLDAFRAGRTDALEQVYFAYVDDVFKLAMLGFSTGGATVRGERDPAEQRAIVQDVFVRAFADRARLGYDGVRPYRPYLLAITRNVLVDRGRARSLENARVADIDIDQVIAADASLPGTTEEDADQRRLRERAAEYVASLDAESRAVIELRFDRELSQVAAADTLGVSRKRVRTLEARVIKGLRRFLKNTGPVRPK